VFQNHFLLNRVFELLEGSGFTIHINRLVPANDGGISLGQAYYAMHK
jgi:hydrogenase maturation protein HypF